MNNLPQNATRERILDAAEKLFMTRGYSGVKLRDIAEAVGMRHASLYYYVPKGKEQLFAEVVRRNMKRHHEQMTRAIEAAGDEFREQIYAVSDWMVSQPPIDLVRMAEVDLRTLPDALAQELTGLVMHSLNEPLMGALQRATAQGIAAVDDPAMASMSLVTMLQGVHHIPLPNIPQGRKLFGRKLVDMLLNGWLARETSDAANR